MGWITIAFHWTMMICTLGLWTPVFLAGRRRRLSVTYMPPGAQPYPPQQPGYRYPPEPPPSHGYRYPPQQPPYGQQPPPPQQPPAQQPWGQWRP